MRTTTALGISSASSGLSPRAYSPGDAMANWDLLEPYVEKSLRWARGTITTPQLKQMVADGVATAFAMIEEDGTPAMALIATIVQYQTYRAARVLACAGNKLEIAAQYAEVLEMWAYSLGASELEAWCRPAMVRLLAREPFNFEFRFTIVSRSLRRYMQ